MSSNRVRYVGGDTRKVAMKPDTSSTQFAINKGDLLFYYNSANGVDPRLTNGCVYPATVLWPAATPALNQLSFARDFAGVADEKCGLQSGEITFNLNQMKASSISVCTAGRFEFDCPSQTWTPNAGVGIYSSVAGGGVTDSQTVDSLQGSATTSQVIGVVAQQEAPIQNTTLNTPQTRVVVDIIVPRPFATAPAAGTYTGTSGQ